MPEQAMRHLVLDDADVRRMPASVTVAAMRNAVVAAYHGRLSAPPRVSADMAELSYVFTVGALAGEVSGFRVYRTRSAEGDQLVAVWTDDGSLLGVIVGAELGARRTGALGAVSVDALARPDAGNLAIIGSGTQAWTQRWAVTAVRTIKSVRIFSPNPDHRRQLAERARTELDLNAAQVNSSREALSDADVIILATGSRVPVIDASDVEPGAHVVTVGPKFADAHETPLDLLSWWARALRIAREAVPYPA